MTQEVDWTTAAAPPYGVEAGLADMLGGPRERVHGGMAGPMSIHSQCQP